MTIRRFYDITAVVCMALAGVVLGVTVNRSEDLVVGLLGLAISLFLVGFGVGLVVTRTADR